MFDDHDPLRFKHISRKDQIEALLHQPFVIRRIEEDHIVEMIRFGKILLDSPAVNMTLIGAVQLGNVQEQNGDRLIGKFDEIHPFSATGKAFQPERSSSGKEIQNPQILIIGILREDHLTIEVGCGTGALTGNGVELTAPVSAGYDTQSSSSGRRFAALGLGKDEFDLQLHRFGIVTRAAEKMNILALFTLTHALLADSIVF